MRSRAPKSATSRSVLVLVLALLGATCTHGPPVGSWNYGLFQGAPPASTAVKVSAGDITVINGLGDRAFTSTTSIYDASTMKLESVNQTRSCCLSYWNAKATTNADGSLDVETLFCCGSADARDVMKESRPHFTLRADEPLLAYSFALVPWLYVERRVQGVDDLSFFPMKEQSYSLKDADPAARPDGVPKSDRGVELHDNVYGPVALSIWYNPCTYVVDAFDWGKDIVQLNSHLVPQ